MQGLSPSQWMLGASLVRGVPTAAAIAALREAPEAGAELPQLPAEARARWRAALADGSLAAAVEAELAALERLGARLLTPADADWPDGLPATGVLRVLGRLPDGPRVAVVGARRADAYGRDLAARVATEAARRGVAVVSGGAVGIDAAAHGAALDAGGTTVVVLGSGLAHASPPSHRRLFARAAAQGAVVSPFPVSQPPEKWTFPRRNAWIAGLADPVVVVQAGPASGALHTARAAQDLGRRVWAAPGPVDSPLHAGCHDLVTRGAALLARPDAWATSISAEPFATGVASSPVVPQHPDPGPGARLWHAAGAEPLPLSRLAEEAGLAADQAASLATLLELEGWLESRPGGRYARSTPRTGPKQGR